MKVLKTASFKKAGLMDSNVLTPDTEDRYLNDVLGRRGRFNVNRRERSRREMGHKDNPFDTSGEFSDVLQKANQEQQDNELRINDLFLDRLRQIKEREKALQVAKTKKDKKVG